MNSGLCPFCYHPFKQLRTVWKALPDISPLHWSKELTCTSCLAQVRWKLDNLDEVKGMRTILASAAHRNLYVS